MDESEEHGWEFVTERKGVMVHRKFMPALDGVMSKFCCVRASGVLDASCGDVAELFEGNTRVAEYNKYFAEGRDLEHVVSECRRERKRVGGFFSQPTTNKALIHSPLPLSLSLSI